MHYLFGSPESKLFGLTIFVAIVVFQVAYIFLQWLYLKRVEYLYYIAYMLASVWYALSEFEALFSRPLFSHILPDYHFYVRHLLPMITLFLYYRFARTFLNLPITRPVLNMWVERMEYFLLAIGISSTLSIMLG